MNVKIKKPRQSKSSEIDGVEVLESEADFKKVAKVLSELSDSAVFWAFHKHNMYYTGISNLFRQAEFSNSGLIYDVSEVIDRMDEIIDEVFEQISFEPKILIGEENPFGSFCGSIVTKYRKGDQIGMFGILSPMRADYEENLSLIKYILGKIDG